MKQAPHLTAALTSLLLLVIALIGFTFYAQSREQIYTNAIAFMDIQQTRNGSALQRAAIHRPDLLPVYGSSEITMIDTPYDANQFFKTYPTGFAVMDIANLGVSSITMAQNIASLGADLRGRKIVISITPGSFTMGDLSEKYYTGNYLRLHAYQLIFSPYLSMDVKRAAAKRMLDFPSTLQNDPIFRFTLGRLVNPSILNRLIYDSVWPFGELQIQIIQLQDHAEVISFLASHNVNPNVRRVPQEIDWSAAAAAARAEQIPHTLSNPYGVEDFKWKDYSDLLSKSIPAGSRDKNFIAFVKNTKEWSDFDILLRVLQELGAQPLILSRPMNVHLWEAFGVSPAAQDTYYTKLHQVVDPYHFPIVDFHKYGADMYFSIDQAAHTSREGWVYVDQTLDAFFHGNIR